MWPRIPLHGVVRCASRAASRSRSVVGRSTVSGPLRGGRSPRGRGEVQVAALDRGLRLELAGAAAHRGQDRRAVLDHLERPAGPLELGDEVVADRRRGLGRCAARAPRRRSARPRPWRPSSVSPSAAGVELRDGGPASIRPAAPSSDASMRAARSRTAERNPSTSRVRATIRPVRRKTTSEPRCERDEREDRQEDDPAPRVDPVPAAQPARARSCGEQRRPDLEQVADHEQVGEVGDRRVGVAVDRDDRARRSASRPCAGSPR